MVLLTPKFVFVAILASLTAVSLAPPADAAAIAMRRSDQHHISDSSGTWPGSLPNHLNHPVLPLPARLTSASGKQTQDGSEASLRGSMKRQSPRDFFASQRRSLTPEGLPPLLTRRDHEPHQTHKHGPPPETVAQQSTQEGSGPKPHIHVDAVNSHAAFGRRTPHPLPDPRHGHGHDHHHHGNHHDHHHGSEHVDDVVVIEGDNDNIHIGGRSPLPDPRHHHHHHDHHYHHHGRYIGGNDMSSAKEDNGLGRRSPEPRHDHHHHQHHHGHGHQKGHGADKVIIKGDDNNVSVHSRSRHQQLNHSPEYPENASHGGHQHHVQARKYLPHHQPHHDGELSADDVEHSKSLHGGDQDRTETHPRSVLINSVEGEEKYLVPDDHQDQRIAVIEGDGISRMLSKAKRGDPGVEGVPGSIEIMSQSAKSEAGQRIASLVLVEPDSTMSEFGNSTFILNASESNHTQVYMVPLNSTDSGVQGEDIPVALKVPVFNPDSASMEGYCATYDPQPPAPAPLSAEPCFYDEPTGPHKSQVFAYTPSTSVIRPMWFSGETDEEDSLDDPSSNSTVKPDGTVDPKTPLSNNMTRITDVGDFGNSTAPPSSIASFDNSTGIEQGLTGSGSGNDSMMPNGDDFVAKAQNVTLVFTPAAPIIPAGSRMPNEDVSDLDDGMPMNDSGNSTNTDTSASPLTSSASGRLNDTETEWTDLLDDSSGLPAMSMPLPHSVPSGTVSPAAVPSKSSMPADEEKDLNVMVGVARDNGGGVGGSDSSNMKAVSTAPYKWKFDRERS